MNEEFDEYKRKFNRRAIIKNIDDKVLIGIWEMNLALTYIFFWISFLSVIITIVLCMTVLRDEEEIETKKYEWYYDETSSA